MNDLNSSEDISADPRMDLEKVFSHPRGLSTARSLVEELIRAAGKTDNHFDQIQTFSQNRPSLATLPSDPAMPDTLKEMLAFSSHNQVSEKGNGGTRSEARRQDEMADKCNVPFALANSFNDRGFFLTVNLQPISK